MSNYCACSGGDEEYTIELNQQGPEGPQGPVGPEGFSPSISVKTSTDNAYILTVVNKEGTFDTPNLYGEIEKLNADLSNIPNPAVINGISLASIENNIPMITMDSSRITTNVDGNLILNATASNEETMEVFNYEVVANPKEQRLELHDNEGTVKIVATTDYIPTIDVATTTTAGIVKPDGSTITVGADGTISANLSNYVTSDELSVDLQDINSKIASKLDTATYEADKATYATKEELASTDSTVTSIQTSLDSKLESSNIIAGANITIDRSGNNLTINSIGGGGGSGAAIDDSTISSASTWSSSKINSEITTVANTKNDNIFDIGRFTVVGTPTITDDGVASGFSLSNVLRSTNTFAFNNKPFEITLPIYWSSSSFQGTPFHFSKASWYNYLLVRTDKIVFFLYTVDDGTTTLHELPIWMNYDVPFNDEYLMTSIKFDGAKYTLRIWNDESNFTRQVSYSTSNLITHADDLGYLDIGSLYQVSGATSEYYRSSIDLKHFSVTIDGEKVFSGLMESTKPIYDKLSSTSTELSTFKTDTDNNFSAVNSALNEKANLSDLAGYVTVNKYNELLARVVALETEINGGNA